MHNWDLPEAASDTVPHAQICLQCALEPLLAVNLCKIHHESRSMALAMLLILAVSVMAGPLQILKEKLLARRDLEPKVRSIVY